MSTETPTGSRSAIVRLLAGLALLAVPVALLVASLSSPQAGAGAGYPYANAVCEFSSAGGPHCTNPSNSGDQYEWGHFTRSTFDAIDPWGYRYRSCTSYVAWRLADEGVNPRWFSRLGNADAWLSGAARRPGSTEGSIPVPGAVAVWNSPGVGCVAFVESVTGGTVMVSDYNRAGTGTYDPGNGLTPSPSGYIYFNGSTSGGTPPLLGTLQGGTFSAKQGSPDAGWVKEADGASEFGVASDVTHGPLLGVLQAGSFSAKEGGLDAGWVREAGAVNEIAVASDATHGPLLSVLQGGTFSVKEGGLDAGWVREAGAVNEIAVASDSTHGPLLGALQGGTFSVKEGGLDAPWKKEATGVSQIAVASDATHGPLLGVLQGGTFSVKEGGVGAPWKNEATGVSQIAVASDVTFGPLLGALQAGTLAVKEGSLGAGWTNETIFVSQVAAAG